MFIRISFMKKLLQLYLILLPVLLSIACNKDDSDEKITYINAGVQDSNFEFHKFTSPISIVATMDMGGYAMFALDTIALELKGTTHYLFTRLMYANPDSLAILNQKDSFVLQAFEIRSFDGLQIATETKSYYVGQGHSTDLKFVKSYGKNQLIYSNENWTSTNISTFTWFSLWDMPLNMHSTILNYDGGSWYNVPAIRYIGFKLNSKSGWIEVDLSNKYNPKFKGYAIQK